MDISVRGCVIVLCMFMSVTLTSARCSLPVASQCIDKMHSDLSTYSTIETGYCGTGVWIFNEAKQCVEMNTDECTDEERAVVMASLDEVKNAINQECSENHSECGDIVSFASVTISRCLSFQGGLSDVINNLDTAFHTISQKHVDIRCNQLENITNCLIDSMEKSECIRYKDVVRGVYLANPRLAQVQFMCPNLQEMPLTGPDTFPWVPKCPTSAETEEMYEKCALDTAEGIETNNLQFSQNLQKQVDCFMSYLADCPTEQRKFIEPRLESYALLNMIYAHNVSIAGFEVKPIHSRGDCDLRDNFKSGCLETFMRTLSPSDSAVERALRLLLLNQWSDKTCETIKYYDYEHLKLCASRTLATCYFPQSGIYSGNSEISLPEDVDYAPSLGPFAINKWGLTRLQNQVYEKCYTDCENAIEEYDDCLIVNGTSFAEYLTETTDENKIYCSTLEGIARCVSEVAQRCPTLIEKAESEADHPSEEAQAFCDFEFDFLPLDPDKTTTTSGPATRRSTSSNAETIYYSGRTSTIKSGRTTNKRFTPTAEPSTNTATYGTTIKGYRTLPTTTTKPTTRRPSNGAKSNTPLSTTQSPNIDSGVLNHPAINEIFDHIAVIDGSPVSNGQSRALPTMLTTLIVVSIATLHLL